MSFHPFYPIDRQGHIFHPMNDDAIENPLSRGEAVESGPPFPQARDRERLLKTYQEWHTQRQKGNHADTGSPSASLRRPTGLSLDFFQADLRGADFRGKDLRNANFQAANLQGAYLERADLRGANLQDANLRGARLRDAELGWANLVQADLLWADLQGTDFRGANLLRACLRGANLFRANLRGACLQHADLSWTEIREADVHDADLSHASVQGANLGLTNWQSAILNNLRGLHADQLASPSPEANSQLSIDDDWPPPGFDAVQDSWKPEPADEKPF